MEPRWKIADLAELVERVLQVAGQLEQRSARVREVPDPRTIRYYTTLGLLDRPLEMQGRTAFYGWRHVWQLLAIKQLQAAGLTLVEVQERLTGADDRTLKKLARVPEVLVRGEAIAKQAATLCRQEPVPARAAFWAEPPAVAPTRGQTESVVEPAVARSALHIKLGEGMTLVLEGVDAGACNPDQLAAIEQAARGLVTPLRRLLAQPPSAARDQRAERNRS